MDKHVISYLSSAMQVFTIRYWIEYTSLSWDYYLIFFYCFVVLTFLILVVFLYCSFAASNSKHSLSFTWPFQLLQYLCFFLITIFFQPVLGKFCSNFRADSLYDFLLP